MTDDVASLSVHQFGERFALSALADHSINISMDLPNGIFDSRSVAVIKQIAGGDSLSIEAKNRQPHSDHIRCKLLFGTNHSIELKVRDEAFSQRILLVPFCFPFPAAQQDFDLLDKLKQENGGVIYCALAAYRVFQIVQLFPGPCGHIWPGKSQPGRNEWTACRSMVTKASASNKRSRNYTETGGFYGKL